MFNKETDDLYLENDIISEDELQDKSYEIKNRDIINCANCNTSLLEVIKTDDNGPNLQYKVECPFCHDRSFLIKTSGRNVIDPINGLEILDITEEDQYFLIKLFIQSTK